MSFGRLSDVISLIKSELEILMNESNISQDQIFNKNVINKYSMSIYSPIKNKYPEITYADIENVLTRFFNPKYVYNSQLDFSNGKNCFRDLDKKFTIDEIDTKIIKIPTKYKKLEQHFQKLFHTPQPEQRTPEWYEYRYKRVTASDTATAVDLNPYEPYENFIVKKCDPDFPFHDNIHCHHGKKHEQIATLIYEHIYNNKVTEFGCLPSEEFPILAASPDGICSKSTLDGKFSDRLGTMLEIKCPITRHIYTKGKICGTICPFYYYCQIQQQLICCDLEKCDFWQCQIIEYSNREEYLKDVNFKSRFTEGDNGKEREINPLITKGCLIQLLPHKYELDPTNKQDCHEFKAKYIYPPRLDYTIEEYDAWCMTTICNWKTNYPELADNYFFDKIIYWKLPMCHNVEIKKRKEWFMNNIYNILIKTWDKVTYYRTHLNEVEFLKKIVNKRKRFYKYETKFELNKGPDGTDLVKNKILFLNDIKLTDSNESDEEENCDFID
tara:strand:+ start:1770 stop:3260 length:1491 start_codon:yes stop_codon:yes gene_type:complete